MQATTCEWKELLGNWPVSLAPRGILVTTYNEQVPFENFALSESFALFDRKAPDTLGARKLIVPFDGILAIKITDVVKLDAFGPLGFETNSSKST